MRATQEQFAGVLLGMAVGDALGLTAENLSPRRIRRLWKGEWRHRFVFGHGMFSDDTEHLLFVSQTLLAHPDDVQAFARSLGWKLQAWLLGVPAGIGLATLKATLKLWLRFPPDRSGVFSAGNGPAMRSAILGAYYADEPEMLARFVRASTRITHTDPRAEIGAAAVASVTAWAVRERNSSATSVELLLSDLRKRGADDHEWLGILDKMRTTLSRGGLVAEFACVLGLQDGVSGYIYHTVPMAIYAWIRHYGDFRAAVTAALNCGGDTDTLGGIVGAMTGAVVGANGIPSEWKSPILEWPRSCAVLEEVAKRLADQKAGHQVRGAVHYFWPALAVRNLIFTLAVIVHGLRRLAPPWEEKSSDQRTFANDVTVKPKQKALKD